MFVVKIAPPIEGSSSEALDFAKIDFKKVMQHSREEYTLTFEVEGDPYGYYPISIITLANDLQLCLDTIENTEEGYLRIAGYPVLQFKVNGNDIQLLDPSFPPTALHNYPRLDIERELRRVLGNATWRILQAL